MHTNPTARAIAAAIGVALLLGSCGKKPPPYQRGGPVASPAYWVWHRSSPLKETEKDSLVRAGVEKLYWQAAECRWQDTGWKINKIATPSGTGPRLVPVVRITPDPAFLAWPGRSADLFALQVASWVGPGKADEIQLDFDCPDRTLGAYADFLRELGTRISPARLSITALADWPRHPDFRKLADSVSSLAPMFYDLAPDKPGDVVKSQFRPMADPAWAEKIARWSTCPKPWLAGLPNFERVSIFEPDGKLAGHLRGWSHDTVFFHPAASPVPLSNGTTLFKPRAAFAMEGMNLTPDHKLVHRMPEAGVLAGLAGAAERAGAERVIYFTLPGPGIQASYSPEHLNSAASGATLRLEVSPGETGKLILKNPGTTDLPARAADPSGEDARGWALELQSEQPGAFQTASPGMFARMEIPGDLPAEMARTIVLRFPKLTCGSSLVSGRILANPEGVKWRLKNDSRTNTDFQEIR